MHSDNWLATWHALHQSKAKETILERRESGAWCVAEQYDYSTVRN